MAKRKPQAKAKPRAGGKPKGRPQNTLFIGDQILATYQALASCCGLTILSLLSAATFGLSIKPSVIAEFKKTHRSEAWAFLADTKNTILLGCILGCLVLLAMIWIISTWRGRKWAIWLHLIFSGFGAAIAIGTGSSHLGSISTIVVAIYCVLRLTGSVGPAR